MSAQRGSVLTGTVMAEWGMGAACTPQGERESCADLGGLVPSPCPAPDTSGTWCVSSAP